MGGGGGGGNNETANGYSKTDCDFSANENAFRTQLILCAKNYSFLICHNYCM